MRDKSVHLYTDGSSQGNPGPGGYGIILEWVGTSYKTVSYTHLRAHETV